MLPSDRKIDSYGQGLSVPKRAVTSESSRMVTGRVSAFAKLDRRMQS